MVQHEVSRGEQQILDEIDNPIEYIEKYLHVLSKADEQGNSELVPLKLWRIQRDYVENRTHRDIILKPRQVGISTAVEASNAYSLFTTPFQRMAIITHDNETSEFLLQNIHRFHRHLPDKLRPEVDWASSSRIRFPKLDNYIYIDSARSDSIGIGHTLNRAHLSELSRWPESRARDLFAGITQTLPMGGYLTTESTPKGRSGLFFDLYQAAKRGDINYKTFFYPWWWDEKYKVSLEGKTLAKITKDERDMMECFGLTPEQIAFRRIKMGELGDLFFQEYPENDVDCWVASDIAVVTGAMLKPYLNHVSPGRQETENLTIWKDAVGGRKYVMGVDVAAGYEKGDFSVGSVLDVRNMEYVARLRGRTPPDLFAEQVYRLGLRYNGATAAVERVGHGHTVIRVLLEKNYPDIYYHLDYDDILNQTRQEPGWKTNVKTKPQMVTDLVAAIRSNDLISYSENLLTEASGLTWEGQQKVRTPRNGHDDEWDAVSIALQIREQTPIMEIQRKGAVKQYASL